MGLQEIDRNWVDWIYLAQENEWRALVNTVMDLLIFIKCRKVLD
jgi:hypothetical protein